MLNDQIFKIKGVGPKVAETLISAGYDTIEKIANATPEELSKLKGIGAKTAEKFITNAKAVLSEVPKTEVPKTEKPKTEKPKTEKPKTEKPKTEKPKTEKPKTEKPKTEKPKKSKPLKQIQRPIVTKKIKAKRTRKAKKKTKPKEIAATYGVLRSILHDRIGRSGNQTAIIKLYDAEFPVDHYVGHKVTISFGNRIITGKIVRAHGKKKSSDKTLIARFDKGLSPQLIESKVLIK